MSPTSELVCDLEQAIAVLERDTSAELVVALADRSGSYGDVDLLWGWLGGLTALAFILWSPWQFQADFILLNVVFCSLLGWLLSRKIPALRRLFTTAKRRSNQSQAAAEVQFLALGVDNTTGRTGILVYLSRLERTLTIVADRGVAKSLPKDMVSDWQSRFATAVNLAALTASLSTLIEQMTPPLKTYLPCGSDRLDQLCNRPVEVTPS